MSSPVQIRVGPGPGGGAQIIGDYGNVKSLDLTWAWGARPASAIIEVASDDVFVQGSELTITVPITNNQVTGLPVTGLDAVFWGIIMKAVGTDSSEGQISTLEFHDNRELLGWDVVFGYFNKRQDLLIPNPDLATVGIEPLIWSKYYEHILPQNWFAGLKTYTDYPFTAAQILDFIFNAPTVHYLWTAIYQEVQYLDPVYDIDCTSGRKLADVLMEISEVQGLVFTLLGGAQQLVWARKGVGYVPANYAQFPANSDHRRLGQARSGLPDSVTVAGGRNRYQMMNIPMAPDWNQNLVSAGSYIGSDFAGFEMAFQAFVFDNMSDPISGALYDNNDNPDDPDNLTGNMLARARAETITMAELADFIDSMTGDGELYRDRRKYQGRTRLVLPVLVYVKELVFRAFSLPWAAAGQQNPDGSPIADFTLVNADGNVLGALSCHIIPTTLVETTYDYVTGAMSYVEETAPGGNGLAIVQGFNFFTAPPQQWRSDEFDPTAFLNAQNLWQRVNFQIDDSGDQTEFIVFDEPVAVSSNLLTQIDGHGVLSAKATFTIPQVRASLCMECEPFSWYQGVEGVNAVQNVSNLNADYVTSYGNTGPLAELPYADGQFALATNVDGVPGKAVQIADYVLEQEPVYTLGGYTNRGNNGTQLTGTIDRVRLRVDGEGGMTEEVDFTTERSGNTFEPERDFERKIQLLQMAPGQQAMRDDARALWGVVAALRHNPKIAKLLIQAFHDRYGSASELMQTQVDASEAAGDTLLNMGTPLWSTPAVTNANAPAPDPDVAGGYLYGLEAVLPVNATQTPTPPAVATSVFMGVTMRDQETVPKDSSQYISLQREGYGLARVMGPSAAGDTVGYAPNPASGPAADYLVSGGSPAVGTLLQAVPDAAAHLVQVRFSGVGGSAEQILYYQSSEDNYIICKNASGATFNVAKPYWIRRSSWDHSAPYNVGPVKLLDAPSNGHIYTWVSHDKRTDNITSTDSPSGDITTDSVVWPQYRTNEPITVSTPTGGGKAVDLNGGAVLNPITGLQISGGTGVVDTNGKQVTLLDMTTRGWLLNDIACYEGNPAFVLLPSPYYAQSI